MSNDEIPGNRRLSEDIAHRLLARAVELDTRSASEITVSQLREAAQEAGISTTAFDTALAELVQLGGNPSKSARAATPDSDERALDKPRSILGRVARNLGALAVAYGLTASGALIVRLTDAPWLVHKATDPLALAIGAVLASRWKAGPARVLLTGLSIALSAEFVFDLWYGVPSIRGFAPHMALILTGVVAAMIGTMTRKRPSDPLLADDSVTIEQEPSTSAPRSWFSLDGRLALGNAG